MKEFDKIIPDAIDTGQTERIIFNAKRDNSGHGILVNILFKILREINRERVR